MPAFQLRKVRFDGHIGLSPSQTTLHIYPILSRPQGEGRFDAASQQSPFCLISFYSSRLNLALQKGIISQVFRIPAGIVGRPFGSAATMTKEEEHELREQLARLLQEHRDLDAAIAALQDSPGSDMLQVQRLKKRKLYLRDRISFIEDQLTPDIIA